MLKFLKWFFGLFSPYVNSFERKVDKFFNHIKSTDSIVTIRDGLLKLMNENLIVLNVWLEKKFKGYVYLDKKTRRQMYLDVKQIIASFENFQQTHEIDKAEIEAELDSKGLLYPNGADEMIAYISQIMAYLRPGEYYHYIQTASFGKLLRDPAKAKLEGDCNQIVTLYIYLFSLKFPLEELKIKLLPEHVCLHFRGLDIEATNGTFQKYEDDTQILPVTEIISTNLLDLADFREDLREISPRMMVKSAQLAYAISSLKPLVAKNLNIAYRNLAISAMKVNDFDTAVFYVSKGDDKQLLDDIYHNAALYYMKRKSFEKASYYASKLGGEIAKNVKYNEGIYYFNSGNIDKALSIFSSIGDEKMKKACYAKQYNLLVQRVVGDKTLDDAKRHRSTYQEMLLLAQKMGDESLAKGVRDTLSKI